MEDLNKMLLGVGLIFFVLTMGVFLIENSQANTYKIHTGIVIAVEYDTWLFQTTKITMMSYSATEVSFRVNGNQKLTIGATYEIHTQGEWLWYAPNLIVAEEMTG